MRIEVGPDSAALRRRIRTVLRADVAAGRVALDGPCVVPRGPEGWDAAARALRDLVRRGGGVRTRGLLPLPPAEFSTVREVREIAAALDPRGDASAAAVVAGRARLADPWVLGPAGTAPALEEEVARILASARRLHERATSTAAAVRRAVAAATGEFLPHGPRVVGASVDGAPVVPVAELVAEDGVAYLVPNRDLREALPAGFAGRVVPDAAGTADEVRGRVAASLALGVAADHVLREDGGEARSRVLAAAFLRLLAEAGEWDRPAPPRPPRACASAGCGEPPEFAELPSSSPAAAPFWCRRHAPPRAPTTAAVGGMVLAPVMEDLRGRSVVALDFRSMYPSLMIAHNLSPETVAAGIDGARLEYACVCADGEERRFARGIRATPGALPRLLRRLRALRDAEADRDGPVGRELKLLANAVYGLCGTRWSPLGGEAGGEVQRLVVQAGRDLLARTIAAAEGRGLRVLYGDTDSVFVLAEPAAARALAEEITAREPPPVTLCVEREFASWVPVSRKRYYGRTADGQVVEKGVATVRSDLPEAARAPLRAAMLRVLDGDGEPAEIAREARAALAATGDADAARLGISALGALLGIFARSPEAPPAGPAPAVATVPATEMTVEVAAAEYSRSARLWGARVAYEAARGVVAGELVREATAADRYAGGQEAVWAWAIRAAAGRVRDAGFAVRQTTVRIAGRTAAKRGLVGVVRSPSAELAAVLAPAGELCLEA